MYVRERLQFLGSVLRETFGDKFLLRHATARVSLSSETRIVVSDIRTQIEADAIRTANGYVVNVTKPGIGPANDDITEQALEPDFTVVNDSDLEELLFSIDEMIEAIKRRQKGI
jgi:molybdopterin-biosynthesis enzyme MoeA-like protein